MIRDGGVHLLDSLLLLRWAVALLEDRVVRVHVRQEAEHPVAGRKVAAQVDCQPPELLLHLLSLPVFLVLDHATDHVTHITTRRWIYTGLEGDLLLLGTPTLQEEDLLQPTFGAEGALAVGHPVPVRDEGPVEVVLVAHQQAQLLLCDLLHFNYAYNLKL